MRKWEGQQHFYTFHSQSSLVHANAASWKSTLSYGTRQRKCEADKPSLCPLWLPMSFPFVSLWQRVLGIASFQAKQIRRGCRGSFGREEANCAAAQDTKAWFIISRPTRRKYWPTPCSSVNKPFSTLLNVGIRQPYSSNEASSVPLRNRRLCDKVFLLRRHYKSSLNG